LQEVQTPLPALHWKQLEIELQGQHLKSVLLRKYKEIQLVHLPTESQVRQFEAGQVWQILVVELRKNPLWQVTTQYRAPDDRTDPETH
jgi:hypothetical protein